MNSPGQGDNASGFRALLLSAESRPLRRALRPLAWVILEEVALDAVFEGGRVVARTSARQIADRLGVDPTTVAKALQTLRRQGLVTLEREKGPAGRFGLSVYTLFPAPGLTLVSPGAADPYGVLPHLVRSVLAEPGMVSPPSDQPCRDTPALSDTVQPRMDPPDMERPGVVTSDTGDATPGRRLAGGGRADRENGVRSRPTSPLSQCRGQTALDLGPGSS
jgi:DNA-binding transcriptional ArsR family regulator